MHSTFLLARFLFRGFVLYVSSRTIERRVLSAPQAKWQYRMPNPVREKAKGGGE